MNLGVGSHCICLSSTLSFTYNSDLKKQRLVNILSYLSVILTLWLVCVSIQIYICVYIYICIYIHT